MEKKPEAEFKKWMFSKECEDQSEVAGRLNVLIPCPVSINSYFTLLTNALKIGLPPFCSSSSPTIS